MKYRSYILWVTLRLELRDGSGRWITLYGRMVGLWILGLSRAGQGDSSEPDCDRKYAGVAG